MKKRYYIAYGSNLNIRQMRMRCQSARIIGTSEIPDNELLFKEGSRVPVAAWEVSAEDELALDRYEGFPTFYYKKEMLLPIKGIRSGKIRMRNIFVYIMHEDRPFGLPSRFYTSTCMEGYKSFGFDSRYLVEAIKNSRRMCHERNEYHPD